MNLSNAFAQFPKTRAIIDYTEYFIQKPQSPAAQSQSWNDHKHSNTFKQLVGISPNGAFIFLSPLYSGPISDREITEKCGFLDKLVPGDDVMADRGFTIRELLALIGCTLNMPPSTKEKPLSKKETTKTRRIARERIHVERVIGRLKNFKILSQVIHLNTQLTRL